MNPNQQQLPTHAQSRPRSFSARAVMTATTAAAATRTTRALFRAREIENLEVFTHRAMWYAVLLR